MEVVKNNVDLIESHLRITPQQLSSASAIESVQNDLVVKEHNDSNAEDASEHESAQSADASNESGSDGKGELGTQRPTPPPQPAKKTKDNSEHKDAQVLRDLLNSCNLVLVTLFVVLSNFPAIGSVSLSISVSMSLASSLSLSLWRIYGCFRLVLTWSI